MPHHKDHEHLVRIKESIKESDQLNEAQKSDSVKIIEEWALEDKAFGTLKEELKGISEFFEEMFSELGLK